MFFSSQQQIHSCFTSTHCRNKKTILWIHQPERFYRSFSIRSSSARRRSSFHQNEIESRTIFQEKLFGSPVNRLGLRISIFTTRFLLLLQGASSGIGRELAKQLAIRSPSTRLILSARREDELNNLVKELQLDFEQCLVLPLDLELQHDCFKSKIDLALQKFDQVDVLINNAGISQRSSIVETSYNVDVRLMNINYLGTITLTKAILPVSYFLLFRSNDRESR